MTTPRSRRGWKRRAVGLLVLAALGYFSGVGVAYAFGKDDPWTRGVIGLGPILGVEVAGALTTPGRALEPFERAEGHRRGGGLQGLCAYLVVGDVPVVLTDGAPDELPPPPAGGVLVSVGGSVRGDVVVGGVVGVVVTGGGVFVVVLVTGGGVLPGPPGGGVYGGGGAWVTTVVVVLPSGLTETTVVGALDECVSVGGGGPPRVDGPPGVGVPDTVWTPAGEVPWPPGAPVPPAVVAGAGPASSATAANAVATTSPATPSTTYPARFGLLLFGGAVVSILVTRELESDPSGRGIEAPRRSG
ncbi:hypothetical protein [Amycolatopsis sp. cmx-8-4]|uniref:hypothetical protein n=1 Tax=Amycolatopsis sp. cmx-8-4 TaxID=2790947 RepID=UPI00397ABE89